MKLDKKRAIKKVEKLYDLWRSGKIKKLAQHEVHPKLSKGSRENYLYFTLPVAINFQRSSPAMWQAAFKTWNDPKTKYLFYPEKVTVEKWAKVQKDLLKYRLAIQTNKHPQIWTKLSETLQRYYKSDPKLILKEGDMDVEKILRLLQDDRKYDFPYLGGPKLSNYWLYILNTFTDAKMKNLQKISIIPDTHVVRSSIKLGIVQEKTEPKKVALAWQKLLEGSEVSPIDMHPVLWNWSRTGFVPEVK